MDAGYLTIILPPFLALVMFGLGLSLTVADFARAAASPRAILVALGLQAVVLPGLCLAICVAFALPPHHAIGLMLVAAAPGGATANILSHLARGDVALNITLTGLNSVLSLVTLPIIVNLALHLFAGDGGIAMQTRKVVEVIVIVILPVLLGMAVRAKGPRLALALEGPVRLASTMFLIGVVGLTLAAEFAALPAALLAVGPAALLFNLASLASGIGVPRLLGIPREQATAIGMEIAIHNTALAIYIATAVMEDTGMAIAPAVYSLIMYLTAALLILGLARGRRAGA